MADHRVAEGPVAGAEAVAAVDCGTNSTRLLVVGPDRATLERLMTITRLGAGVDRTRSLAPDAIGRTVDALRRYRSVMDQLGVTRVRMTATSAVRDATNRDAFFGAARDAIGVDAELLGGESEARLSFAGATAELDLDTAPWLVADIGGGSTELAVGPADGDDRLQPRSVCSLNMGCVRLTERFFTDDPPSSDELRAARQFVRAQLDAALAEQPDLAGADLVVGLAGTVAAAAALDQRLAEYDRSLVHHYRLTAATVGDLLAEMAVLDTGARAHRPGMEKDRAGVIVGGLVVLDELLACVGASECLTSESDILDGLAQSLLGAP